MGWQVDKTCFVGDDDYAFMNISVVFALMSILFVCKVNKGLLKAFPLKLRLHRSYFVVEYAWTDIVVTHVTNSAAIFTHKIALFALSTQNKHVLFEKKLF